MLELCFTPVSGGFFISQVAILTTVLEARSRSMEIQKTHMDIYFGASGGSLTNILCSFFSKNSESVERILYTLHTEIFIKNWWKGKANFMSSLFISFFKEGVFQTGEGAEDLITKFSTDKHFMKTTTPELWTLSYNMSKNCGTLSSSKSRETSFVDLRLEDLEETNCGEIKYLNGDEKEIIRTAMASASIPGIKESVQIDGSSYVDGGVCDSSPGTYFTEIFIQKKQLGEVKGPYHYYYINSKDFKSRQVFSTGKMWVLNMLDIVKTLMDFNTINNRKSLLENWLRMTGADLNSVVKIELEKINIYQLIELLEKYHNNDYFITFSAGFFEIDILNFSSKDLKNKYRSAKKEIKLEILINVN